MLKPIPHLLEVWPSVRQFLRDAHQVLLLLDYDGTLTPIVERPELAVLSLETKETLSALSLASKYIVGIISARRLEDVRSKVGIDGLIYAGNHGLEMQGPGLDFAHPEAVEMKGTIESAYQRLNRGLDHLPGVFTEYKGVSLTVHFRVAGEGVESEVRRAVGAAIEEFTVSGKLLVSDGKMALEIRPKILWDKGDAIKKLQSDYPTSTLAIFFGDDFPDERGFTAVQNTGGIGVFVGPAQAPTGALYRVDSPDDVGEVLGLMAQV